MKILYLLKPRTHDLLKRYLDSFVASAKERGIDVSTVHLAEEDLRAGKFALLRRLRGMIKQEGFALVHSHDPDTHPFAALAAKAAFVPSVYTQHFREYKRTAHWPFALDAAVLCASEDLKKDLLSYHRVSSRKLRVIYNGVDVRRIDAEADAKAREELRAKLGFGPSVFVIGNIAPCVKEEDQASIIKAIKKLASRELDAQLLISGEGPIKDELIKVAEDYGVKERLKFYHANGDPYKLLSALDCLVLTPFNEGRPYTVLEAMAARKPVIASSIGANKEVIEERKNGYLVPCGFPERIHSAVMRLNAIKELPQQIGEAGRRLVEEKFTLERTVNSYGELYKELV